VAKIIVAGQTADFQTDVNITIMNALKNGWPAAGAQGDSELQLFDASLNPSGVKIGTTWWDGQTFFQVHVTPLLVSIDPNVLGSTRWGYTDRHYVHIFAKGKNMRDKKWKLEKEVAQQIMLIRAGPAPGICWWDISDFREAPEPASEATDWKPELVHSVAIVTVHYEKVKQ